MNCGIILVLILFLGVSSGTIITGILKELTPTVAGIGQTIEGVTKDVGSVIGDTFFSLDRIIADAEISIDAKLTNFDLRLSKPDSSNKELCVSELKNQRNNLNVSIIRNCLNTVNVRNSLSESLVQIGLLRSECFSIISRCMFNVSAARQCIIDGAKTVESELNSRQIKFRTNVDSIKENVNDCVTRNQQDISAKIDAAMENYNKCITG